MKRDQLRQSLAYLLIGLVVFACVNISWADGVVVEVPYAATNAQWWTGVAIKNLDEGSATSNMTMEFFDTDGELMGAAVDIAPLDPRAIYSQVTSNIYLDPLPVSYSIRVSHPGNQELAVTVFVGNSATGGFAYQTYKSQACNQATAVHSWDQVLPTVERFELVMPEGRSHQAVLDRETGLVWQRDTNDTLYDCDDAQAYCYKLELGGRKGWRLPTIDELATLVDSSQVNPSLPDGHPFTNVKSSGYWSSTTYANITPSAWLVHFYNGVVYGGYKTNSYYVRAVRSGQ